MSKIQCLSKEHIYLIHEEAIKQFGGDYGYYDYTDGRIESIIALQYPIFGHDKYPGSYSKAAMLMYFFTKGHCFVDGNKRVGAQSAIVFLDINGYDDLLDDDEGYLKTMEIAEIKLLEKDRDQYILHLSRWLSKRFKKRKVKLKR